MRWKPLASSRSHPGRASIGCRPTTARKYTALDSSAPLNPNEWKMHDEHDRSEWQRGRYFGVPAEDDYGYAQAIKIGNTIHVSGQLSQDDKRIMIAPAALDESGKPADFSTMEEQMRVTYVNAAKLLARFGATLDHVVEETLYVLDVDAAFAVAGKVRKEAYAVARPQCASNLIGVSRLAFPEQLIEIVFKAVLPPAETDAG